MTGSGMEQLPFMPTKNNLPLFRSKNTVVTSKSKQRIANLEADRRLYANLFVACQARDGDLDNFFAHENYACPVSLSEYGKLRKSSAKSDFLQCLNYIVKPSLLPPNVAAKIIDAAAFVNINKPKTSERFGQYYSEEIPWKVQQQLGDLKRFYFVLDTCKIDSIKGHTREGRAIGVKIAVRKETPIAKTLQVFLKNSHNKTELLKMLAINITKIPAKIFEIKATHLEEVLSNNLDADLSALQPCNHEEADTRLLLHALNASKSGFKRLLIVTVDTDVAVLALCHICTLNLQKLWIEIGTGKNPRWPPIHLHAETLHQEMCQALPFWFALTGCDSVSMFAGREKKDGMVCMAKIYRSNTTFQKVKYLSPICNSSKIIGSSKFDF